MTNLIKNCRWLQSSNNAPACFTLCDATHDCLCIDGCRTVSSTRCPNSAQRAIITYDKLIPVCGQCCCLRWGCMMRAADCECMMLVAECIDSAGVVISKERRDVTCCVCGCFNCVMASFCLPRGTRCVRLSVATCGKLTAFTCFAPTACFA